MGIVGLSGVAPIHLLDSGSTYREAPYDFWLHTGLMLGTLFVAALLLGAESPGAWGGAALLAGGTIFGFALSRTLGLAAVLVEGCVVARSVYRLAMLPPRRGPAGWRGVSSGTPCDAWGMAHQIRGL